MSSLPQFTTDNAAIVDLERDLLRTDIVLESVIAALKTRPWQAMSCLARLALPDTAGQNVALGDLPFDPAVALYRDDAVAALKEMQAGGQEIVVVSRLPAPWTEAIRAHLGLAWVVAPDADTVAGMAAGSAYAGPTVAGRPSLLKPVLKVLRLHQWAKNLLVFVPLGLSHRFFDTGAIANTLLAFVAFGLAASAIYVLNDMLDIGQDRRHASKCRRPFASGALPVKAAFILAPLLALSAFGLALALPFPFVWVLATYAGLNLGYVFVLKRKLLVDVLALAGGYTLRLLAGNAAGPVELSSWLLAFSMFLFLSLALVKRYVELDTTELDAAASHKVMGRGYRRSDLDMLAQLGVSSGFSAVVVMALYVDNAGKQGLYRLPELIWLICPIILFVIARIWVLAKRRELPDDPVMFIIKDWRSHLMGLFIAAILVIAK